MSIPKICRQCGEKFIIEDEDLAFYKKISPTFDGKTYEIPPPALCFECRLRRRLNHRNEQSLYARKCDAPGHDHSIIALYDEEAPCKVYCQKYWWSDSWDPISYGQEFDLARGFFEQFGELLRKVPRISIFNTKAENSEYCNYAYGLKNCYLEIGGIESNFTLFSYNSIKCRDSADCYMYTDCENCYELLDSTKCYNVSFSRYCENCRDSSFLYDCKGCSDCFGSIGLRNKSYYFFNKGYSKEEYENKVKDYDLQSFSKQNTAKRNVANHYLKYPYIFAEIRNSENVVGNNIFDSKNSQYVFDVLVGAGYDYGTENCRYMVVCGLSTKDSLDFYQQGANTELGYEICGGTTNYSAQFCVRPVDSRNLLYCENCDNCQDCFGCTGLRRKQYCVLNKQYSEKEYGELVAQIIEKMQTLGEWGEFFPPDISLFAFNETPALYYFPMPKDEVLKLGFKWKDKKERSYQPTLKYSELKDSISEVDDSILEELVSCQSADTETKEILEKKNCATAFKILPQELELYRKLAVALPRKCPNCRFYERIKSRGEIKLYDRRCECAGKNSSNGVYKNTREHHHGDSACESRFMTAYPENDQRIIYCTKCYEKEIL